MVIRHITLAALMVLIGACNGVVDIGPSATVSDSLTFTEEVTTLRIDNPAGEVQIEGSDTDEITVERTIRYTGDEPDTTAVVDGDTLTLDIDCRNRRRCAVDYSIQMPTNVTLDLNLASATVSASDVKGNVKIEAASGSVHLTNVLGGLAINCASGSIRLTDIDGDLDLNTASGSIDGTGLVASAVQAHSASGSIDLAFDAEVTDLVVEAASGSVIVSVPGGPYRVETDTGSGDIDVNIATDPAEVRKIDIRTASGDITINGA